MVDTKNPGENDANTVERLTRWATSVAVVDGIATPFARDGEGNIVSLEHLLARPLRIREQASLHTVSSFIDYVNLHKRDGSVVVADEESGAISAIIDYHDASGPSWAGHRAHVRLQKTTGMANWSGQAGRKMSQEQFGLFVEENAADIVEPAAATMMQIATEMRAHKKVDFDSKVQLDNGSFVFAYKEDVKGTFQDGKQEIPSTFQLGLIPYKGMPDAYKIEAKLRYRINGSALELWFALPTLERAMELAFDDVRKQVAAGTGLKVLDGKL